MSESLDNKIVKDNFKLIYDFIDDIPSSHYYMIQLINRESKRNKLLQTLYIYSKHDLIVKEEYIKNYCKYFNCRAYIQLNVCCKNKVMWELIREYQCMLKDNRYNNLDILSSISAINGARDYYLVDVDSNDEVYKNTITKIVDSCKVGYDNVVKLEVPTVKGFHLIALPFDLKLFKQKLLIEQLEDINVCKQCMTLLYYNDLFSFKK